MMRYAICMVPMSSSIRWSVSIIHRTIAGLSGTRVFRLAAAEENKGVGIVRYRESDLEARVYCLPQRKTAARV